MAIEDMKEGIRRRIDSLRESDGDDARIVDLTPEMQVGEIPDQGPTEPIPFPKFIEHAEPKLVDPSHPQAAVETAPPKIVEPYDRALHLPRLFGITWAARLPFDLDPPDLATTDPARVAEEMARTYALIAMLRRLEGSSDDVTEIAQEYIRAERSIRDRLRAIEARLEAGEVAS